MLSVPFMATATMVSYLSRLMTLVGAWGAAVQSRAPLRSLSVNAIRSYTIHTAPPAAENRLPNSSWRPRCVSQSILAADADQGKDKKHQTMQIDKFL